MKTSRELFLIKVKVKTNRGKVYKLSKGVSLEITWSGNKGKGKKEGKIVNFEKDGQKFPILVKISEISRTKKRKRVNSPTIYSLLPIEGSNFDLEYEKGVQRIGWGEKEKEQWNVVEVYQGKVWWKEYPFLIPVIVVSVLLLVGGILAWVLWKKKKRI